MAERGQRKGEGTHMLHVMSHVTIMELCDPAIVSELHSDDSNASQLVDVIKLLMPPPPFWYEPLSTYKLTENSEKQNTPEDVLDSK